jgi:hypothetical protein
MPRVSVNFEDGYICVDGECLTVDMTAIVARMNYPRTPWAIQWDGQRGHIEWADPDQLNTEAGASNVDPYVLAHAEARAALPPPPDTDLADTSTDTDPAQVS